MGAELLGVLRLRRAGPGSRASGLAAGLGCVGLLLAALVTASPPARAGSPLAAAPFLVGAAQEPITPTSLAGVYLGGYGIGPVHPAKRILRPIYAHAMAVRSAADGHTLVFAALDVQGHFAAYQQGPYGFSDLRAAIAHRYGIPAANIVISATHTHNGPDDLGVWGGVPTAYLAYVASQTEAAIGAAIGAARPARLVWGTEDVTGLCGSFGTSTKPAQPGAGDQADYPIDNQLRVLQARAVPSDAVIATMVNVSCHATVYGPLDEVSPDWPGATVSYLEHAEQGATGSYGYPGSQAVVMVGAVGHTWPAAVPARFATPQVQTDPNADDNYPADQFGNAVGQAAVDALARPSAVVGTEAVARMSDVQVVNDNPVLAGFLYAPVPGYHIDRATSPPYTYGDVLVAEAGTLRLGDLAFFSVPGEGYPSLLAALKDQVHARGRFVFSLAQDQLGYVLLPADLSGAAVCSSTDEFFFTISPTFGAQVLATDRQAAAAEGFRVTDPGRASLVGTGPPPTNCAAEQLSQPSGP